MLLDPLKLVPVLVFFDHMLDLFGFHAGIRLKVVAEGDLVVDQHHTVEDVGIALGKAIATATGDRKGIARYATTHVPLNEALGRSVVDVCGRGQLVYDAVIPTAKVGEFDSELAEEFFRGLCDAGGITAHVDLIRGTNSHHCLEVLFKSFGRAFGESIRSHDWHKGIASTKGVLGS